MLYVKLAWKNLFRNKRRTLIAGTAIGVGLASLIFTDAVMIGMERNMVDSATSTFLGDGQIHGEGFRETQDVEVVIHNLSSVLSGLAQEPVVRHFSPRVLTFAMVASAANVSSVTLVGIRPKTEQDLSQIDEAIVEGTYFGGGGEREIVIGSRLAEILEVQLGDRLVVTVSQASSGDLRQELFRLSGIYHFNVRELDQGMAFVRLPKAQSMLAIGDAVHEIALRLTGPEYGRQRDLPLWNAYSRHGNEAIGWSEILPQLEAAFRVLKFSTFIVGIILFGVVALGIINTLFMSLHERMFEFGILRAVGTRPSVMGRLIVLEAGALAVVSIGVGVVIGLLVTYMASQIGINYGGIEFVGVTFRGLLYPVLNLNQFVVYPFSLFVLTALVGIYPAVHAARMAPADAMRRSL